MGTKIRDIVPISLQIAARAYSSAEAFSIPLLLSNGSNIAQRAYTFTSLSEITDAGFSTSTQLYKWASCFFGQTSKDGKKPSVLKVFQKASANQNCKQSISFDADASAGNLTITVGAETTASIAYTADAAAIKSALDALTGLGTVTVTFNTGATKAGDAEGFTIEFSGDATVDFALISVNIAGLTGVTAATITKTQLGLTAETWAQGYAAAKAADDAFYFVGIDIKPDVIADIDTLHTAIEADYKQLWIDSDNANIKDGTTTNIASSIKSLSLARSAVFAHYTADEYVSAAEMGATIPDFFGSVNPAFYPLALITADSYTSTQIGYLVTNGANRIERVGNSTCLIPTSAAATTSGTQALIMGNGQFSENLWIKDYLETVVSESIYNLLVVSKKIPFTKAGFFMIKSKIMEVLQTYGVEQNLLEAGTIDVTMPDFDTYSGTKKAARWLDGVEADGTLQGAINKITISGFLAV